MSLCTSIFDIWANEELEKKFGKDFAASITDFIFPNNLRKYVEKEIKLYFDDFCAKNNRERTCKGGN
jgi:hypothetical protein